MDILPQVFKSVGSYQLKNFNLQIWSPKFDFDQSSGEAAYTGTTFRLDIYLKNWNQNPPNRLIANFQAKVKYLSLSILLYYSFTQASDKKDTLHHTTTREIIGSKELYNAQFIGEKNILNIPSLITGSTSTEAIITHASLHQPASLNETPLIIPRPHSLIHHKTRHHQIQNRSLHSYTHKNGSPCNTHYKKYNAPQQNTPQHQHWRRRRQGRQSG